MKKILCVTAGGGLGALLRYQMEGWIQDRLGASFPYGTLIVNLSGAFGIGFLMTLFLEHIEIPPEWRLFLVVGVLGGYTTFSSLTWEAYQLWANGGAGGSLLYAMGTFIGGFAALLAGVLLGRLV